MHRPTWAEVDLSAIRDNIRAIREKVGPKIKLMPAVKANAYGHGAVPVSRACLEAGADVLSVCCVEEAQELRQAGIRAPILILGCSMPESAGDILQLDVASAVCDADFAQASFDAIAIAKATARTTHAATKFLCLIAFSSFGFLPSTLHNRSS